MDAEGHLARATADQGISDQSGFGAWETTTGPITRNACSEGEMTIGTLARKLLAAYEQISGLADACGCSPSRLIGQRIHNGLDRADTGDDRPDPTRCRARLHMQKRAHRIVRGRSAMCEFNPCWRAVRPPAHRRR